MKIEYSWEYFNQPCVAWDFDYIDFNSYDQINSIFEYINKEIVDGGIHKQYFVDIKRRNPAMTPLGLHWLYKVNTRDCTIAYSQTLFFSLLKFIQSYLMQNTHKKIKGINLLKTSFIENTSVRDVLFNNATNIERVITKRRLSEIHKEIFLEGVSNINFEDRPDLFVNKVKVNRDVAQLDQSKRINKQDVVKHINVRQENFFLDKMNYNMMQLSLTSFDKISYKTNHEEKNIFTKTPEKHLSEMNYLRSLSYTDKELIKFIQESLSKEDGEIYTNEIKQLSKEIKTLFYSDGFIRSQAQEKRLNKINIEQLSLNEKLLFYKQGYIELSKKFKELHRLYFSPVSLKHKELNKLEEDVSLSKKEYSFLKDRLRALSRKDKDLLKDDLDVILKKAYELNDFTMYQLSYPKKHFNKMEQKQLSKNTVFDMSITNALKSFFFNRDMIKNELQSVNLNANNINSFKVINMTPQEKTINKLKDTLEINRNTLVEFLPVELTASKKLHNDRQFYDVVLLNPISTTKDKKIEFYKPPIEIKKDKKTYSILGHTFVFKEIMDLLSNEGYFASRSNVDVSNKLITSMFKRTREIVVNNSPLFVLDRDKDVFNRKNIMASTSDKEVFFDKESRWVSKNIKSLFKTNSDMAHKKTKNLFKTANKMLSKFTIETNIYNPAVFSELNNKFFGLNPALAVVETNTKGICYNKAIGIIKEVNKPTYSFSIEFLEKNKKDIFESKYINIEKLIQLKGSVLEVLNMTSNPNNMNLVSNGSFLYKSKVLDATMFNKWSRYDLLSSLGVSEDIHGADKRRVGIREGNVLSLSIIGASSMLQENTVCLSLDSKKINENLDCLSLDKKRIGVIESKLLVGVMKDELSISEQNLLLNSDKQRITLQTAEDVLGVTKNTSAMLSKEMFPAKKKKNKMMLNKTFVELNSEYKDARTESFSNNVTRFLDGSMLESHTSVEADNKGIYTSTIVGLVKDKNKGLVKKMISATIEPKTSKQSEPMSALELSQKSLYQEDILAINKSRITGMMAETFSLDKANKRINSEEAFFVERDKRIKTHLSDTVAGIEKEYKGIIEDLFGTGIKGPAKGIKIETVIDALTILDKKISTIKSALSLKTSEKDTTVADEILAVISSDKSAMLSCLGINIDKGRQSVMEEAIISLSRAATPTRNDEDYVWLAPYRDIVVSNKDMFIGKGSLTTNCKAFYEWISKGRNRVRLHKDSFFIDSEGKNTAPKETGVFMTPQHSIEQENTAFFIGKKTLDTRAKDNMTLVYNRMKDLMDHVDHVNITTLKEFGEVRSEELVTVPYDLSIDDNEEFLERLNSNLAKMPYIQEIINDPKARDIIELDITTGTIDDEFINAKAKGVDELLLPGTDYDYNALKDSLFDYETGEPVNPVKKINDTTFIARLPVDHPLTTDNSLGREYLDVDVELMKFLLEIFYHHWQNNIFEYGIMDVRDAVNKIIHYMEIFVEYRMPWHLHKQCHRIVSLIKWYGEKVITEYSQFKITFKYKSWKSNLHKKRLDCEHELTNMFINDGFVLENSEEEAEFWIKKNVKADGYITASARLIGEVSIYINGIRVAEHSNSFKLKLPLESGENTIAFFFKGQTLKIGNIEIENCEFDDIMTKYEYSPGSANMGVDRIMQRVCNYYMITQENLELYESAIQGAISLRELSNNLVEYFDIHHLGKEKGKRLTIKKGMM